MADNNPHGGVTWTDDQVAELEHLLATGTIYRVIADRLNEKFGTNFSKNSVVGKVSRLGLFPVNKPGGVIAEKRTKKRSPKPRVKTVRIVRATHNSNLLVAKPIVQMERLRCVEIEPRHLSLFDLEAGDCRYPHGDDVVTFCGHPKMAGSSYCTPHHFLCTEKPRAPIHRFARVAA